MTDRIARPSLPPAPLLAAALLALLALLPAPLHPAGEEAGRGPPSTDSPITQRLGLKADSPMRSCWQRIVELSERRFRADEETRPASVEFAVATLPDPLFSGFARELDLFLAAIRRSMEGMEFVHDRHCLPWRGGADPGDAQREARAEAPPRHPEPGVIVFRGVENAEGRARVLFVVNEHSAGGVDREALGTALSWVAQAERYTRRRGLGEPGAGERAETLRLRILGPTFSGGADSLGSAVAEWFREQGEALNHWEAVEVRFVSGTATATDVEAMLESSLEPLLEWRPGPPVEPARGPTGEATAGSPPLRPMDDGLYLSTAADNKALTRALWNDFAPERLGICTCGAEAERGAVALLQESSLYGREFEEQGFLVFPFPMNISQVASRWEDQRREREGGREEPERRGVDAALDLRLDRARTSSTTATFDPARTTASMDLVLSNILDTIARKRVRIVAIAATSTEDKIFLAERISERVPNVRLVTFEGDILLAHPRSQPATRGMIVVSSNPLVDPPSAWSGEVAEGDETSLYLHFATDGSQGIFRAVRRLLPPPGEEAGTEEGKEGDVGAAQERERGESLRCDEPEAEDEARRAVEPGAQALEEKRRWCPCEEHTDGPDVWVSVVGRGGLYPVRRYPSRDPDPEPLRIAPARAWWFLWGLTTFGLVTALAWGADRLRRGKDVLGVEPRLLAPAVRRERAVSSFVQRRRLGLLALTGVFLAGLYLMWSVPLIHPGRLKLAGDPTLISFSLLVALLGASAWVVASLVVRVVVHLRHDAGRGDDDLEGGRDESKEGESAGGRRADGGGHRPGGAENGKPSRTGPTTASVWGRTVEELVPCLLAAGAVALTACLVGFVYFREGEPGFGFFLVRAQSLAGGVNPLPSTVLLLGIPLLWLAMNLDRYRSLPSIPHPAWIDEKRRPGRWVGRIRDSVAPGVFTFRLVALLLFVPAAYLTSYYPGTWSPRVLWGLEHRYFDLTASLLFFAGVALAIGAMIGSWRGWRALRRLLDWLPSLELRLPGDEEGTWLDRIAAVYKPALGPSATVEENRRSHFAEMLEAVAARPAEEAERRGLGHLVGATDDEEAMARTWMALAPCLARRSGNGASGEAPGDRLGAAAHAFFAWQTAHLVRTALGQLLQLLLFMTVALLLLLAAVSVYPFQPRSVLAAAVGSLILLGAAASVVVVLQVERNPILSQLTGTPAGLTWHRSLVARFGLFAGLPLVSLLASRFPWLREQVGGWLGPLLEMLR